MKKAQLIENTLILPHEIPLFDYNVNFHGLKKLLEDLNLSLNNQKQEIDYLKSMLAQKADKDNMEKQFSLINGALDLSKPSMQKLNVKQTPRTKDKRVIDQIVQKLGHITSGLDKVLNDSTVTDKNLSNLEKQFQDKLKRLQNQMESKNDNLDKTITKNIESYFKDVSTSSAKLEAALKDSQSKTAGKLADAFTLLDRKINMQTLQSKISGIETKLLGKVNMILDEDGMKRVKLTNDLIMNSKNAQNNFNDKFSIMQRALSDLTNKTNQNHNKSDFEKERNKIYQNINQAKSRLDDVQRKSEQFFEFKRNLIVDNQKNRVQTTNIIQMIQKLKQKIQSAAGLSNVQGLLEKIDPHKICEIDNLCRLHSDSIGKLQKKIMQLSDRSTTATRVDTDHLQKTQSLGVDEIIKIIKDYLMNMDVESRIKKNELDIKDFHSTIDLIKDMDRKIQLFTKQFDYGYIVKQLQRRCLDENTRKQSKITNGRIDQLHQFLKMMRKDVQSIVQYVKTLEFKSGTPEQNALLSSKKLYPLNCLSCLPGQSQNGQRRRSTRDVRKRVDNSMDYMGVRNNEEEMKRKLLSSFQSSKK